MTIETIQSRSGDRKDFLCTCDSKGCKKSVEGQNRTFNQFLLYIKARGWKAEKVFSSWLHRCPDHAKGQQPFNPEVTP